MVNVCMYMVSMMIKAIDAGSNAQRKKSERTALFNAMRIDFYSIPNKT